MYLSIRARHTPYKLELVFLFKQESLFSVCFINEEAHLQKQQTSQSQSQTNKQTYTRVPMSQYSQNTDAFKSLQHTDYTNARLLHKVIS